MKGEHPGGQKGQVELIADHMGYTGRFDGSSSYLQGKYAFMYVIQIFGGTGQYMRRSGT